MVTFRLGRRKVTPALAKAAELESFQEEQVKQARLTGAARARTEGERARRPRKGFLETIGGARKFLRPLATRRTATISRRVRVQPVRVAPKRKARKVRIGRIIRRPIRRPRSPSRSPIEDVFGGF